MIKESLQVTEYDRYYEHYLALVPKKTNLFTGLEDDKNMVVSFFRTVPSEKLSYRYQPEKWSIKEILQHIIDTERIFMYRLLRIARNDNTPLAGYDQDAYIIPSEADSKSITELINEFCVTRDYTSNLVHSFSETALQRIGIASDVSVSARACAFIILGHSIWHINIIKERYL